MKRRCAGLRRIVHFQRNVHVKHSSEHPAYAVLWRTHQPPVLQSRLWRLIGALGGNPRQIASRFGGGCPSKKRNLRSLIYLVKMLGVTTRFDVQVGIIARGGGPLDGSIFIGLFELLKSIVDRLGNQITLLNPTLGAGCGPHPGETAVAIENLYPIAIPHDSLLVVDGGYPVAQIYLRRGNVRRLSPPCCANGCIRLLRAKAAKRKRLGRF